VNASRSVLDPSFALLPTREERLRRRSPEGQALTKENRCLPSALLGLSPPKLAALLERTDTKKSAADASAPPAATPPPVSVASAYRARRPSNNLGSWVFGLFGW
jgi:hypothetical protein